MQGSRVPDVGFVMSDPVGRENGSEVIGRGQLREAALGGVRWITTARLVAEASQFIAMIVLARLISPTEFGYAAIALIVQGLVVATTSEGITTPLVQKKALRSAHVAGAQAVVLVLGVTLTALTAALAPLVVEPAFGPETAHLVQLASLLFVISSIGVVPQALLQRELQFRRISVAEIISSSVGASVAVVLALVGLEGEAVVLGVVAASLTFYTTLFVFARPPAPRWRYREIREIIAFGAPASLSSVLRSGFRNIDYVILGLVAGPATVGYYWRAFQLGVEYQRKISGIMVRIALPIYSRASNLSDMQAVRDRIVRVNASILFPILTILIATAPEVIPWMFGPEWEPAVVPTQILAVAGMCAAILSGVGPLILAVGRPKALLAWDAASFVVYAVGVYLAAGYGVVALCLAVTGIFVLQLLVAHVFLLRPIAGVPARRALLDILPASVASAALVVVAVPIVKVLGNNPIPTAGTLTAAVLGGLGCYVLTLRWLFPGAWSDTSLVLSRVVSLEQVRTWLGRVRRARRAVKPMSYDT